jgi:glycosyltransferase involved in cell wall biosynthesis
VNSKVDLTVIIPVYNGGEYLQLTLDSVVENMAGLNVECVVVNDGSTDESAKKIAVFSEQIRIFNQPNSGESAAVNKGLDLARGKYALVVSADDPILSAEIFDGVVNFFENNPDVMAWYPDWRIIDENGRAIKINRLKDYSFTELFAKNKVLAGPGTWFRVDQARHIGGRQTKWKYVGDFDFWLRLSNNGRLEHRPGVLAQWRQHPQSTSISERGKDMARERIEVIAEFINQNHSKLDPKEITLAKAHSYFLAARLGFFSREIDARNLLFKAIRTDFRVALSIRPLEMLFLSFFPYSNKIWDLISKYWK